MWVFVVISIVASLILEPSLPEPLAAWLKADAERDITAGEFALLAAFIPLLVSIIVATAGLLCLQRWAAWLYLVTTVIGTLLMPFTGPTVEHALADTIDEIGIIMSGMVIALAFFTDSLKKKDASPMAQGDRTNPQPAP